MTGQRAQRNKKTSESVFLSKYGIYLVFGLMIVILSFITDSFFTVNNALNVLRQVSIFGMLAVGMTFVIITGGIDLSIGSTLAFAGIVATMIAHPDPYYPVIVIVLLGIAAGGVIGLLNGLVIAFSNVTPFIVTLGMMTIARGATLTVSTGRPNINLSENFQHIGQGTLFGIPIPIFFLITICTIGFLILHKTKIGRYVYAIGGNEMAAKVSGVNMAAIKIFVYTFMGIICGLSGVLLASRTNAGAPNAGSGYELYAIAAVVIGGTRLSGGRGTIIGSIVGTLILGILSNGLDILNVSSYIQQILTGMIIIGSVWIDQMKAK